MFWCFKLSYRPQLKSACRNGITSRGNSLCEWNSTLRLLWLAFPFFFLFLETESVNESVKREKENEEEDVSLPLTWDHPPLPPHPTSFNRLDPIPPPLIHSFIPGGEETAASSGIWHHNYIGSRRVCRLLELERLLAAHTCAVNNWY